LESVRNSLTYLKARFIARGERIHILEAQNAELRKAVAERQEIIDTFADKPFLDAFSQLCIRKARERTETLEEACKEALEYIVELSGTECECGPAPDNGACTQCHLRLAIDQMGADAEEDMLRAERGEVAYG
jgi:hypothetical protein